jgi:hypothetical protein
MCKWHLVFPFLVTPRTLGNWYDKRLAGEENEKFQGLFTLELAFLQRFMMGATQEPWRKMASFGRGTLALTPASRELRR